MPELPEVETIKQDLQKVVLNQSITKIKVIQNKTFINPKNLDVIGKITKIDRVGKNLIIDIEKQCTLIIQLRMTGKLIYDKKYEKDSEYCRVVFYLGGKEVLAFYDIRAFGRIEVVPYQKHMERLKSIGIDALSKDFTLELFKKQCNMRKIPIKTMLLDQHIISGIGNIYAMEILFDSKISPLRVANTISDPEIKKLYTSINKILRDAIKHNGTTISDYRRVDDKTGDFQNFLQVYGKTTCPICNNRLTKVKIRGRVTRYCNKCQK